MGDLSPKREAATKDNRVACGRPRLRRSGNYPMPDAKHAKPGPAALQQRKAGNLSKSVSRTC